MAPFLAQTEYAPHTGHAQCWQSLLDVDVSGGGYRDWSSAEVEAVQSSTFRTTWHDSLPVTPYKPRSKGVDALNSPYAEKCSLGARASASLGSAKHGSGQCKPCAWYHKPVGCAKGQACIYCHICDDKELKTRRKAKMAALRSGQTIHSPQNTFAERDLDMDMSESEMVTGAEPSLVQPILPIQLESLLPDAAAKVQAPPSEWSDVSSPSDFALASPSTATCGFPSLPRSAPPVNPPMIQNFDVTPPPPPLQDLSACDQWQQWDLTHELPWIDTDCSQGMTSSPKFSFDPDVACFVPESAAEPPPTPPGPRRSPPEVLGDGRSLWSLSSCRAGGDTRVLIVTRRAMMNAYEVADAWDPCPSSLRTRSSPAEMRYSETVEVGKLALTPVHLPSAAVRSRGGCVPEQVQGDDALQRPFEPASPAREAARQARAKGGQPGRMMWRPKESVSPTSKCSTADAEEVSSPAQGREDTSPSCRGGRPRVGRAGPRSSPAGGCDDEVTLGIAI